MHCTSTLFPRRRRHGLGLFLLDFQRIQNYLLFASGARTPAPATGGPQMCWVTAIAENRRNPIATAIVQGSHLRQPQTSCGTGGKSSCNTAGLLISLGMLISEKSARCFCSSFGIDLVLPLLRGLGAFREVGPGLELQGAPLRCDHATGVAGRAKPPRPFPSLQSRQLHFLILYEGPEDAAWGGTVRIVCWKLRTVIL